MKKSFFIILLSTFLSVVSFFSMNQAWSFESAIIYPAENDTILYSYRPTGNLTFKINVKSSVSFLISTKGLLKNKDLLEMSLSPSNKTLDINIPLERLLDNKSERTFNCHLYSSDDNSLINSISFKIKRARKNALWHWPSAFDDSRIEQLPLLLELNKKGMNVIFARYGHFSENNDNPGTPAYKQLNFEKEYFKTLFEAGVEIHLSFSFSEEFRQHYDTGDQYKEGSDKFSSTFIINNINKSIKGIEKYISGIQLDMEGLKSLNKYSHVLSLIRNDSQLGDYLLSICPQVSWKYKFFQIRKLLSLCDFAAIMIYDHRWGVYVDRKIPILSTLKVSDPDWIRSTIKKYDKYKIPFYAGVPSYDYIKVYDSEKKARDHWSLLRKDRQENIDFLYNLKNSTDFECQRYEEPLDNDHDLIYQFKALKDTVVPTWNRDFSILKGEYIKADILTADAVKGYCTAAISAGEQTNYFTGFSIFKLGTTSADEFPETTEK